MMQLHRHIRKNSTKQILPTGFIDFKAEKKFFRVFSCLFSKMLAMVLQTNIGGIQHEKTPKKVFPCLFFNVISCYFLV